MTIRIRRSEPTDAQTGKRLMTTPLAEGIPETPDELWEEISGYIQVLLGRDDAPVDSPYLSMMEIATAYYARAQEIDATIHNLERTGEIRRGSPLYKFRTGELRAFLELSKKCADLGSRRLTQETLLQQQRYDNAG